MSGSDSGVRSIAADPTATTAQVPALYVGVDGKLRGGFWTGDPTRVLTSAGKVNFSSSARNVDGKMAGNCVVTVDEAKSVSASFVSCSSNVTVTSSALTTGSYAGNIAISAPGTPAGNSPQNTAVSLDVTAAATYLGLLAVVVRAAGRIYRNSVLRTGARVPLREAWGRRA